MLVRSFTSSSERECSATYAFAQATAAGWAWLLHTMKRSPRAMLFAIALGIIAHLWAALVYTVPVARPDLRDKVRTLTSGRRPSVLIAGDSRFECGIMPDILARELGLAPHKVINMAEAACDTSAFVAAYNEFANRFDPDHLVVLDLSFFQANDGSVATVSDELLWNLSFRERYRLAGPGRALRACFLPEKTAWQDFTRLWPGSTPACTEAGFEAAPGTMSVKSWSPVYLQARATALAQRWYSSVNVEGTRWQQLCKDVETLKASQKRLIVVLMPFHPAFLKTIENTPAGEAERAFRLRVTELCARLDVPCLQYQADCFAGNAPDSLFHDLIHLNRAGAQAFTPVLARDLARCSAIASQGRPVEFSTLLARDRNNLASH